MARALQLLATVVLAGMVVGCGMSKDQISQTVKTSMQEKFDSDSQFKDLHLTVTEVRVLSKGGNLYGGIARIAYKGSSHDVAVDITVDGNNVMWQVAPGAFAFVIDEMQRLQNTSQ